MILCKSTPTPTDTSTNKDNRIRCSSKAQVSSYTFILMFAFLVAFLSDVERVGSTFTIVVISVSKYSKETKRTTMEQTLRFFLCRKYKHFLHRANESVRHIKLLS